MTVLLCKVPLLNHTEKETAHGHKRIKTNSDVIINILIPSGAHISPPYHYLHC